MYKEYSGTFFPKINVKEFFDGDYNKIAKTLGYGNFQEVLKDQSMNYEQNKHNPFLMKDMDILVERVKAHIDNKSNILIFGDFDVDGISASATLVKGLYYLGVESENLDILIPNREVGYSIKREYILEYVNNPKKNTIPDLIITVDCGIKSSQDIDYIVNDLGIEVIVTDHHGVDEMAMPKSATAIVNPHRSEGNYPFKEISGSLVALKVVEALDEYYRSLTGQTGFIRGPQGNPNKVMYELQELAMLGTVADVMPIINENKWLVKDTLIRLPSSNNTGLRVFTNNLRKQYTDSGMGKLNTDFIGWQIGPRINAAGRIGNPYMGLHIFLEEQIPVVERLFQQLTSVNVARQEMLKEDYLKTKEYIESTNLNKGIVYVDTNLEDGIIGLIAGRLKEDFYRPTIAIGGISTVVDVNYAGQFTQEEEMAIYKILFGLNQDFYNRKQIDLFHGASIKDGNKIIFSIAENLIGEIETEFANVFNNLGDFVTNHIQFNSKDEETLIINALNNINISSFSFEYNQICKGSCRSVEGFNITNALQYLNEQYIKENGEPLLLGFGGHPLAAGFGLLADKVEIFKSLFENYANQVIDDEILKKEMNINIEIEDFELLTESMINNIYSMGPYGNRNEYPKVMLIGEPKYVDIIVKRTSTAKLHFQDAKGNEVIVMFFRYTDNPQIEAFINSVANNTNNINNTTIGIAGTLALNEFNGFKTVQVQPLDIVQ